jgi:hypothetical protein
MYKKRLRKDAGQALDIMKISVAKFPNGYNSIMLMHDMVIERTLKFYLANNEALEKTIK